MKLKFEDIANKLNINLLYARPDLANVLIDDLSHNDFNEEGLLMIVSPIFTTGLPINNYRVIDRLFEVSVVAINNIDFVDEEADVKINNCQRKLYKILDELKIINQNSINTFASKYDNHLCGAFTNIVINVDDNMC